MNENSEDSKDIYMFPLKQSKSEQKTKGVFDTVSRSNALIVRRYLGKDLKVPSLDLYTPRVEKVKVTVARCTKINPLPKTKPR